MKTRTISQYKLLLAVLLALGFKPCFSQIDTLVNNYHTIINVQPEAIISIEGHLVEYDSSDDVTAAEGRIRLNGSLQITGDIINKSHSPIFIDEGIPGNLIFAGDEDQRILDGIGNLGNDTTIYMPSLIMNKDGGALFVQQTVTIDSTIRFDPDNVANIHVLGTDTMIMQASGIIVGERNLSSRIYFEEGNISVEVPTFSNLEGLADTPDELSIENLFGLGWGYTNNLEQIKGEDGDDGDDISVSRHDTIAQSITQIANGNYLSRFYRLEFYESDRDASAPDLDTLTGVVFHFFDEDLNGLSTDNLSMYVSNDDGESWLQMDNGVFNSATLGTNDSTQTLLVENVPVRGTVNDSDAINWFVVAESACNTLPNTTNDLLANGAQIDNGEELFIVDVCINETLELKYQNSSDIAYYSWSQEGELLQENDTLYFENIALNDSAVYTLMVRNQRGCEATRDVLVKVWPDATIDFTFENNTCTEDDVVFTPLLTTLAGNEGSSYEWSFIYDGTGEETIIRLNDSESITRSFDESGSYTVTLTVETINGCTVSNAQSIAIQPLPASYFLIKDDAEMEVSQICSGETLLFEPDPSIFYVLGNPGIPELTWDFGDGTTITIPAPSNIADVGDIDTYGEVIHEYETTTNQTYMATLTAQSEFGCTAISTQSISIYAQPDPTFTIQIGGSDISNSCVDQEIMFTSNASLTDPSLYIYSWNFGDEAAFFNQASLTKSYDAPGNYTVTLDITSNTAGNCVSSSSFLISIEDAPVLPFANEIQSCESTRSLNAGNSGATYQWTYGGNVTTDQELIVSSPDDTPQLVNLVITNANGCSIDEDIIVTLNTAIEIDLGPDFQACGEATIGANNVIGSYTWSTDETSTHIQVYETGTYWVEVVESGESACTSSDTIFVEIFDLPTPDLGPDITQCGDETITITPGAYEEYLWSDRSQNSALEVGASGEYWVQVTDEAGCSNTDTLEVIIFESPELDFPEEAYLCGQNGILLDPGYDAASYEWGSSTGFTSMERSIEVVNEGTYWLTTITENGCMATDTTEIQITTNSLQAEFLVASEVAVGDSLRFVQLTEPLPESSLWAFGDGIFSTETSPVHLYGSAGDYTITLAVSNGFCSDTLRKEVNVINARVQLTEEMQRQVLFEWVELKTYPNPTKNELNLEIKLSKETDVYASIYDVAGKGVYEEGFKLIEGKITIDLSDQLPGIYILNVAAGTDIKRIRLMKE